MDHRILVGPSLTEPLEPKTIGQYLFERAQIYSENTCQIDAVTGEKETYASVKRRSTRVAIEMKKRGVTSEDHVQLCSGNTLDSTIPWVATTLLAAKISSIDPGLSVRDVNHLLKLIKPKTVFVQESSVPLIENSLQGTELKTKIVVLGNSSKYSTLTDFLKPSDDEKSFRPTPADPEDIGVLFFSSGTTGLPKGICWTHNALMQACHFALPPYIDCSAIVHFTSLYWVTANMLLIRSFLLGTYRVLIPKFEVELTFKAIERYKVSFILAGPAYLNQLAGSGDAFKYDTSKLKHFYAGGIMISPQRLKAAREVFKDTEVCAGYGMSEGGFISSYDGAYEVGKTKLATCGKLNSGYYMKIVDIRSNQILGANQKGEIRLKHPYMMRGYLHMDSSDAWDEDGYLKTGDIGYYDKDNFFYLVDRIKDMFKYKAYHIVPSSLEIILLQHPDVKEAMVYGAPAGEEGLVPAAFVVLKEGSSISGQEIARYFNEQVLERERLVGGVRIVDHLKKNVTGKLLRNDIRNYFLNLAH